MPQTLTLDYEPPGATLAAFRASTAFARALIGPIHGGRKTACVYDIMLRTADPGDQLYWRWLVVNASLDELEAHTIPAWLKWVPQSTGEWTPRTKPGGAGITETRITFAMGQRLLAELHVVFLGLDRPEHRRRLGAMETTGVWLAAARDLPEASLDDAISSAGTYPPALEGGARWSGVILSSRPPPADHWLPRRFDPALGRPDYALFKQPSGLSPRAENLAHLPKGFYARAAKGKPADWVRTNIEGECLQSPEALAEARQSRELLMQRLQRLADLAASPPAASADLHPEASLSAAVPPGEPEASPRPPPHQPSPAA